MIVHYFIHPLAGPRPLVGVAGSVRWVHAMLFPDARPITLLTLSELPPVIAYSASSTILVPTASPHVLTNAASSALFVPTAPPPMPTNVTSSSLLARTALPPMPTECGSAGLKSQSV